MTTSQSGMSVGLLLLLPLTSMVMVFVASLGGGRQGQRAGLGEQHETMTH